MQLDDQVISDAYRRFANTDMFQVIMADLMEQFYDARFDGMQHNFTFFLGQRDVAQYIMQQTGVLK